ncbi:MAG TPA: hypothetical protein VEY71_01315, partial [Chitinophagales bacterium]|nr:hypothetical protein [Chitinophagales bacterium]
MKRLLAALLAIVAACFVSNAQAQIVGSDTVCAGYRYSYTATIPGAAVYNWAFPPGWTTVGNATSGSITVDVNESTGDVCAIGFDGGGTPLDTLCVSTAWGQNMDTVSVVGANLCPCWYCPWLFSINVLPNASSNCGNGIPNPNVVYAVYEDTAINSNYLGTANGFTPVPDPSNGLGASLVLIPIDTAQGLDVANQVTGNVSLVQTFDIPPVYPLSTLTLRSTNAPICATDTFTVFIDTAQFNAIGAMASFTWSSSSTNAQLFQQTANSVKVVFSTPGIASVSYIGNSTAGCVYNATKSLSAQSCIDGEFVWADTVVCTGNIYTYTVFVAGASYFEWSIPDGWYFWSDSTLSSVQLAVNTNPAGDVCVVGFAYDSTALDTTCVTVEMGTGSGGLDQHVEKIPVCHCWWCTYILVIVNDSAVIDTSGGPGTGCGTHWIQNPNLAYAVFDSIWPQGNFLGYVDSTQYSGGTTGLQVFVYLVDTTFAADSIYLLVEESGGAGQFDNDQFLPGFEGPDAFPLNVDSVPCIGDTFTVSFQSFGTLYYYSWFSLVPELVVLQQNMNNALLTFTAPPSDFPEIYYDAYSNNGVDLCPLSGYGVIPYAYCGPVSFTQFDEDVCAGYVFSYAVDMPGATTFDWQLPSGWYVVGNSDTSSIVAAVNQNVGDVCVTGYDDNGVLVNSICETVSWGTPSPWSPNGYQLGNLSCPWPWSVWVDFPNGCGNGSFNTNVQFAAYDGPLPGGNAYTMGQGFYLIPAPTGSSTDTVYLYAIDMTTNALIAGGGAQSSALFELEAQAWLQGGIVQSPDTVCIGDTFQLTLNATTLASIASFNWSANATV